MIYNITKHRKVSQYHVFVYPSYRQCNLNELFPLTDPFFFQTFLRNPQLLVVRSVIDGWEMSTVYFPLNER